VTGDSGGSLRRASARRHLLRDRSCFGGSGRAASPTRRNPESGERSVVRATGKALLRQGWTVAGRWKESRLAGGLEAAWDLRVEPGPDGDGRTAQVCGGFGCCVQVLSTRHGDRLAGGSGAAPQSDCQLAGGSGAEFGATHRLVR
jgi:hypothetical protein